MKTTGCQHLSVTANDELVKDIPELTINLSAVAKGFGVDEMVRVLRGHGLTNIYASIAGEVRVLGHNPRGTNWQVGITAPVGPLEGRRSDGGRRVAFRPGDLHFRRLPEILHRRAGPALVPHH